MSDTFQNPTEVSPLVKENAELRERCARLERENRGHLDWIALASGVLVAASLPGEFSKDTARAVAIEASRWIKGSPILDALARGDGEEIK